jgi:hypothetical protein
VASGTKVRLRSYLFGVECGSEGVRLVGVLRNFLLFRSRAFKIKTQVVRLPAYYN